MTEESPDLPLSMDPAAAPTAPGMRPLPGSPQHAAETTLRPEVELLLCCARTHLNATGTERLRALLQTELDWHDVYQTASHHGLLPLLAWHLQAVAPDLVPTSAMEALRSASRTTRQYNFFLLGELRQLLELFAAHNISVVPFKGPALAVLVYGNLALRTFGDLDVMVFRHDLLRAKDLLLSAGYQLAFTPQSAQDTAPRLTDFYILLHHEGRVRVDLQWRIKGRSFAFALDTEGLQDRLLSTSLAGTTTLTFAPEDLLIILCVHGSKHLWGKLKWICDVAEMLRRHAGMDWQRVRELARQSHSERMLALGLYLAHHLLGATLSEPMLQTIQADKRVKTLAAQIQHWLFAADDGVPGDFARLAFYLKSQDSLWDKVQSCGLFLRYYGRRALVPNARDKRLLPLPDCLAFLYYVIRPLRLIAKYARQPGQFKNLLPHHIDLD